MTDYDKYNSQGEVAQEVAHEPRIKRAKLLELAEEVAGEYGGNLTLRQLYYQLVARGYIANIDKEYKRLGAALSKARLSGDFPFDWLTDRTRENRPGNFTRSDVSLRTALVEAEQTIHDLPEYLIERDPWWGQKTHVSVWVEKEALAGVFEEPCEQWGVSWFVARGYSSLSALYDWAKTLHETSEDQEYDEAVVLYFGDFDPDGWEIPRSAERNINKILKLENWYWDVPPVRFERVALMMDQIRQFNPPPFPAKVTSKRYAKFVEEHSTTNAWELDALDPKTLEGLINASVRKYFDVDIYNANKEIVRGVREQFRETMLTHEWMSTVLEHMSDEQD